MAKYPTLNEKELAKQKGKGREDSQNERYLKRTSNANIFLALLTAVLCIVTGFYAHYTNKMAKETNRMATATEKMVENANETLKLKKNPHLIVHCYIDSKFPVEIKDGFKINTAHSGSIPRVYVNIVNKWRSNLNAQFNLKFDIFLQPGGEALPSEPVEQIEQKIPLNLGTNTTSEITLIKGISHYLVSPEFVYRQEHNYNPSPYIVIKVSGESFVKDHNGSGIEPKYKRLGDQ